jgi:hypothetical protein
MPFATIVVKDYPGHNEASRLDRPGTFALNIGVGRALFAALLAFGPAAHPEHTDAFVPPPWACSCRTRDAMGAA